MAYKVRIRTLPGSPMVSEYDCAECGRFEQLVTRNDAGDPPESFECPECGESAELTISAPMVQYWSRPPVPIGYASKSDEKDPRALDTEPLATGKMTKAEWKKWQRGISAERRYQKRLKAGKISKRIQVGGG
jgi:putative FmdB family regulatory protein